MGFMSGVNGPCDNTAKKLDTLITVANPHIDVAAKELTAFSSRDNTTKSIIGCAAIEVDIP